MSTPIIPNGIRTPQFAIRTLIVALGVVAWLSFCAIRGHIGTMYISCLIVGASLGIGAVRKRARIVRASTIAGAIRGAVGLGLWGVTLGVLCSFVPSRFGDGLPPIIIFGTMGSIPGLILGAPIGLVYGLCAWRNRKHNCNPELVSAVPKNA